MTEINKIPNVQVSAQKSKPVQNNDAAHKENKKGISKKGVLIAASTAIAATVIGGILYNKHVNITKEIDTVKSLLNKTVEFQKPCEDFCKVFNPEILQGHIDDAAKLGKKEQLARLKEIRHTLGDDRGFEMGLTSDAKHLKIDTTKLPKEVQDAIATKDQLKATEAYIKYCDSLFHKSKTAGSTVQESVVNVFGKDTKVSPHTYDISKEADRIATAQYGAGGYNDITVTSDNMIVDRLNHKNMISLYSDRHFNVHPSSSENACIVSGMRDGKPVVSISYRAEGRDDLLNAIELLSPTAELTPAQRDLLKLKDSAAKLDVSDLQIATNPNPTDAEYGQTNFDAILSAIHTLASKVE